MERSIKILLASLAGSVLAVYLLGLAYDAYQLRNARVVAAEAEALVESILRGSDYARAVVHPGFKRELDAAYSTLRGPCRQVELSPDSGRWEVRYCCESGIYVYMEFWEPLGQGQTTGFEFYLPTGPEAAQGCGGP